MTSIKISNIRISTCKDNEIALKLVSCRLADSKVTLVLAVMLLVVGLKQK